MVKVAFMGRLEGGEGGERGERDESTSLMGGDLGALVFLLGRARGEEALQ